ncbi:uncharacterized protein [Leptinotarsa decemlineata]|uniref:uncharacterized protein n=1 Tax=Leptinotarsa decemlineata TaxID=7539 RepID=UPI003D308322
MSLSKFESELLTEWLSEMQSNEAKYKEPILDIRCSILLKEVCSMLRQDIHVFVFSINILEEYISRKTQMQQDINDPALTLMATVFISSKYIGDQDLKSKYIESVLRKISGQRVSSKTLKLKEMEILKVLDNCLPLVNDVDDLNTFIVKFEKESKIKATIIPLCMDILEMLYLTRNQWFFELKVLYTNNNEALSVFKRLMKNRLYLPMGILLYVFNHTLYTHSFDVSEITNDLSVHSQIHVDHLNALVSKIHDVIGQIPV